MPLEDAVTDCTVAIRELIALLKGGAPLSVPVTPAAPPAPTLTATPAPEPAAKPAGRPRKAVEPTPAVAAPAPAAEPVKAAAEPVTYEQTATALMALAKRHGRDAAVATLAVFGVKLLPDLKPTPERFAEFIAACEAQV